MAAKNRNFDLEERLLDYAPAGMRFTEGMNRSQAGVHVAGQLLRSGTSPLPNHGEAQTAESNSDFIPKMSICPKELRESRRWLRLTQRVPLVKAPASVDPLLMDTEESIRIFYSGIATAKKSSLTERLRT